MIKKIMFAILFLSTAHLMSMDKKLLASVVTDPDGTTYAYFVKESNLHQYVELVANWMLSPELSSINQAEFEAQLESIQLISKEKIATPEKKQISGNKQE